MSKIFAPLTKLLPEPEKVHRRPYDVLRCPHEWPVVFTIRPECENFYHRVSILCQLRDSVTPAQHLYVGGTNNCSCFCSGRIKTMVAMATDRILLLTYKALTINYVCSTSLTNRVGK